MPKQTAQIFCIEGHHANYLLLELRDDLEVETRRVKQLVESLLAMKSHLSGSSETLEEALRLHNFYAGIERILRQGTE